jgi:hypothetical protein
MSNHIGGRSNICPSCSIPRPQKCVFYTKAGKLTRYAFLCGYVEKKGELSLWMQHGVYHVNGFAPDGKRLWESFDTLTPARKFLSSNGLMITRMAA